MALFLIAVKFDRIPMAWLTSNVQQDVDRLISEAHPEFLYGLDIADVQLSDLAVRSFQALQFFSFADIECMDSVPLLKISSFPIYP